MTSEEGFVDIPAAMTVELLPQNLRIDAKQLWTKTPEIIREFLNQQPDYEQLCTEVAYTLSKRLSDAKIGISAVMCRAKTLESFLEKIDRKHYQNPLTEITDFAGVRVVYLYPGDFPTVEKIICEEFEVLEKVDKLHEKEEDRFGYGAIHFLLRLGKPSTGARYDHLKNLVCELQVRTVLQDAWAIIDHHLAYKKESDVPTLLRRKLNSLAGLF